MRNITIVIAAYGITAKLKRVQLVAGALSHAIPVYALFVPSKHLDQNVDRLPQVQGYTWKRSDRSIKGRNHGIDKRDNCQFAKLNPCA